MLAVQKDFQENAFKGNKVELKCFIVIAQVAQKNGHNEIAESLPLRWVNSLDKYKI